MWRDFSFFIVSNNPRIATYLAFHEPEMINSEIRVLFKKTTSEACASLRGSIRENKGVTHPIIVNEKDPFHL